MLPRILTQKLQKPGSSEVTLAKPTGMTGKGLQNNGVVGFVVCVVRAAMAWGPEENVYLLGYAQSLEVWKTSAKLSTYTIYRKTLWNMMSGNSSTVFAHKGCASATG